MSMSTGVSVPARFWNGYLKNLLIVTIALFMSSSGKVVALSDSVVVVGLNAALQKRFILAPATNLVPGDVHRAHRVETGVGGKGQDVGVALSCLASREVTRSVLLAQFLGVGPAGDAVASALRERHGLGNDLTVRNAAPLRTCTTVVGADAATELVETSGAVTADEMATLTSKVQALAAAGGRADGVCIMGSLPPGCGEKTYADLMSQMAGRRSLVLIDSVVGLEPLLDTLARMYAAEDGAGAVSREGGAVLKLNAAELCRLASVAKSAGEAARATQEELVAAARGFMTQYPAVIAALDYLCVTDGRWPGHLIEVASVSDGLNPRMWELPVADLSAVETLYPIGAGDAVAAGTLAAWQYLHHNAASKGGDEEFHGVMPSDIGAHLDTKLAKWSNNEGGDGGRRMATAFAFGLACGAASCLKEENSVFEVEAAAAFFDGTKAPARR